MPFLLDYSPSNVEISDAVNYLLANLGSGVSADQTTGEITSGGVVVGYLYKYIQIKYADSFDGSLNFSDLPLNRLYYGLRNNNSSTESDNPADYVWNQATGGFGTVKKLWYQTTGGRQIKFAVSQNAPDTGWLVDPGYSIDLDVVTSGNIPVIAESFVSYFTPNVLQVPRSGNPLVPSFTNISPVLYSVDKGAVVTFVDAQTDTAVNFVNNTWRIGNSSTTGYGDISYANLTIGNPTDAGDYAQWPNPTAMSNSPAYITVPIRYKNSLGDVSQAAVATVQLVFIDPGATGLPGPSIDINGYTSFVQNAGGAFTPTSATLSAVPTNVTAPTYSWSISGATPTSATTASVVVTPTSSSTGVSVTLTVNGSNLLSPLTKTINMPVVYDGVAGQAGANGLMSAFPTIYIWTGSSVPPTRPSTTSTYTWATGAYTAPSGWSVQAPSNTTAGNYLWSITVPLNVTATTTTSTLDWTNTSYPIRAIAYNGVNGVNGLNGANGSNGLNGSATFVVTRSANDSSPPTDSEVTSLLGRTPVAGDIATVSYNNFNNAVVYRFVTSWTLFQTYITGSLIVQNTITADKMVANLMSADNVLTRGLTVRDTSGNIILASGTPLNYSNITPSSGWLNSNISLSSNGVLSGAGGGSVTLGGLGAGGFAYLNQITSSNVSTYIAGAAIGTAQIGVLTAGNIGAGTIDASKIAANTITAGQIASNTITATQIASGTITADRMVSKTITAASGIIGDLAVDTLQIAGNAVTIPISTFTNGPTSVPTGATPITIQSATINSTGAPILVSVSALANSAVFWQITRDGVVLYDTWNIAGIQMMSASILDTPGSGLHTYRLNARSGFSAFNVYNMCIYLLETKK